MATMDHLRAAKDALATTAPGSQARDPSSIQAQAILGLAHAAIALTEHLRGGIHTTDSAPPPDRSAREPRELGEIVQVVPVKLGDTLYYVERYDSKTIRVLDTRLPRYVAAKPVLRRINEEKGLGVDLNFAFGQEKNTRTLGREVMRALLEQKKAATHRGGS